MLEYISCHIVSKLNFSRSFRILNQNESIMVVLVVVIIKLCRRQF